MTPHVPPSNRPSAIHRISTAGMKTVASALCLLAILIPASGSPQANAQGLRSPEANNPRSLRIASWHLEGLWHVVGEPLRAAVSPPANNWAATSRVRRRSAKQMERLREAAQRLDADVVALQGAGSLQAVRRLFPARTHLVVFSQQLAQRLSRDQRTLTSPLWRQGYTAIAIRRRRGLRVLKREHVRDFITPAAIAVAERHPPVAGTAIELLVGKRKLWVLSVAMTPLCAPDRTVGDARGGPTPEANNAELSAACRAVREQARVLNDWIANKEAEGAAFVIAGRFPDDGARRDTPRRASTARARQSPEEGSAGQPAPVAPPAGDTRRASDLAAGRGVVWDMLREPAPPKRVVPRSDRPRDPRRVARFRPPSRAPGEPWRPENPRGETARSANAAPLDPQALRTISRVVQSALGLGATGASGARSGGPEGQSGPATTAPGEPQILDRLIQPPTPHPLRLADITTPSGPRKRLRFHRVSAGATSRCRRSAKANASPNEIAPQPEQKQSDAAVLTAPHFDGILTGAVFNDRARMRLSQRTVSADLLWAEADREDAERRQLAACPVVLETVFPT